MARISIIEKEMAPERVAQRLTILRQALGLKKSEFADQANIDRSSYSKIEKAEKPLALSMGYSICEVFGVSLDYLYRGQTDQLKGTLGPQVRAFAASNQE